MGLWLKEYNDSEKSTLTLPGEVLQNAVWWNKVILRGGRGIARFW